METQFEGIEEQFLDRNDLFGLHYREGLVFLEVKSKDITKYKPYSGLEDIEADTNLDGGFQRLEEPGTSNDILEVDDTDKDTVIHAAVGHKPWFLRRFTRYPEDSGVMGDITNLQFPRPSDGDTYGYIDGKDSPYDAPSSARELVIPYGPNLSFDFYNPDNSDHEPILNIKMAQYKVRGLVPTNENDKNMIKRSLSPGTPIPIYIVGTPGNRASFNSDMKNVYGVAPIPEEKLRKNLGV